MRKGYAVIRLIFDTSGKTPLLDLSSLLYDFELLYDFHVLTNLEEYSGYEFGRYFWYRTGRPISYEDRLKVTRIQEKSPLELVLIASGYVAAKVLPPLIDSIERIADFGVRRQLLKEQVRQVQLENEKRQLENENLRARNRREEMMLQEAQKEIDEGEKERRESSTERSLVNRLRQNRIRLVDMSIEYTEMDEDEQ